MKLSEIWLFRLTENERSTWVAGFGGRVLDAMDAQIYALALPTLIGVFSLSRSQAGILGSLTTLIAAISTIFAGAAADRFGRLRVLQVAIGISATATILTAFAHNFAYLSLMRAVQGIGYGAELTAAMTLVSEAVRGEYRGRAVSAVQSGYAVGYALALVAMLAIYTVFPQSFAWRVLFGLGVLPALYVLFLQFRVKESALFLQTKKVERNAGRSAGLLTLLRGENRFNTIVTVMISAACTGAAQVMIFWLPTYLHNAFHMNVRHAAAFLAINILGSFLGPIIYGPFCDRYGRRPVFLVFLVCQMVSVTLYLSYIVYLPVTFVLGLVVGILQGGLATGVMPIIAELFGTGVRGRAVGVNSAFIRAFTAITPALVGFLAEKMSFGLAMGGVAMVFYVLAIAGVILVRETRGVVLTAGDTDPLPAGPGTAEHGQTPAGRHTTAPRQEL